MTGLVRAGTPWAREHGRTETAGYLSTALVCAGCGEPLPVQHRAGNPRRWCSDACRVRTYRQRRARGATS